MSRGVTYFSRPTPTLTRADVLGLVVSHSGLNTRGTRGVGGNPLTPVESAALGEARRGGVLFLRSDAKSQQLCNAFFKYCWSVERPYVAVDRHGVRVCVDLRPLRGLSQLARLNRWKLGLLRARGEVAGARGGGEGGGEGATAAAAGGTPASPSPSTSTASARSLARRLGVCRLPTLQLRKLLALKRVRTRLRETWGLRRALGAVQRCKRDHPGLNVVTARTLVQQRKALLPGPLEGLHTPASKNRRLRLSRIFTVFTPTKSAARSCALGLAGALGVPTLRQSAARAGELKELREERRRESMMRRLVKLGEDPLAMKNLRVPAGALEGFLRYQKREEGAQNTPTTTTTPSSSELR